MHPAGRINSQIDAYRKIVELKKESLSASREESKYEDEVAERISSGEKV